jgi:hypothetical protein
MPLARDIAAELRRVADALDLNPDAQTDQPHLSFSYLFEGDKEKFLNTARILPRPIAKHYPKDEAKFSRVSVTHETPALKVSTSIYREAVCVLIEPAKPAKYDCVLTLLDHEDAALVEG